MSTKALARVEDQSAIEAQAKPLAGRIQVRFGRDCNAEQALEVARLALTYNLDPLMGELIPYQGNPYITISGIQRIASRNPMFDGYEDDIVWGEKLAQLQQYPNEVVWECTVYRKDRRLPVRAYGRAGGAYDNAQPVAKARLHEMAQKRAIHRALRAAFPVPIPGLEEHITPEQLRAIHAYDREQGVSDDERHAILGETFGVERSNELTKAQAGVYLDTRQAADKLRQVDEDGVIIETTATEAADTEGLPLEHAPLEHEGFDEDANDEAVADETLSYRDPAMWNDLRRRFEMCMNHGTKAEFSALKDELLAALPTMSEIQQQRMQQVYKHAAATMRKRLAERGTAAQE